MARNRPVGGRVSCCVYATCGEVCPSGRATRLFHLQAVVCAEEDRVARSDAGPPADLDDRGRRSSRRRRSPDRPARQSVSVRKSFVSSSGTAGARTGCCCRRTRGSERLAQPAPGCSTYMNGHKFISGDCEHHGTRRSPSEHDATDLAAVFPLRDRSLSSGTTRGLLG